MGQQQLENHKEAEELVGGRKEFHLHFLLVLFCQWLEWDWKIDNSIAQAFGKIVAGRKKEKKYTNELLTWSTYFKQLQSENMTRGLSPAGVCVCVCDDAWGHWKKLRNPSLEIQQLHFGAIEKSSQKIQAQKHNNFIMGPWKEFLKIQG